MISNDTELLQCMITNFVRLPDGTRLTPEEAIDYLLQWKDRAVRESVENFMMIFLRKDPGSTVPLSEILEHYELYQKSLGELENNEGKK